MRNPLGWLYPATSLLLLILFLYAPQASAQYQVSKRVVAAGGGAMGSSNFGVSGSSGQLGVGPSGGVNYSVLAGYWFLRKNTLTAVEDSPATPRAFSLAQNYPNPFNPKTTITFSLPVKSAVRLKVFDLSGRLVEELVNEVREAGTYSETFAASSLASGTYFYRMETNGLVRTRKLVLLK